MPPFPSTILLEVKVLELVTILVVLGMASLTALEVGTVVSSEPRVVAIVLPEDLIAEEPLPRITSLAVKLLLVTVPVFFVKPQLVTVVSVTASGVPIRSL